MESCMELSTIFHFLSTSLGTWPSHSTEDCWGGRSLELCENLILTVCSESGYDLNPGYFDLDLSALAHGYLAILL